jgi:hypothetical protein
MKDDPLVEEVRAARRRISAEHGHDIHRLFEHYRKREEELRRTGKARFIEAPTDTLALREEPKPYKP